MKSVKQSQSAIAGDKEDESETESSSDVKFESSPYYKINIEKKTTTNTFYRHVLFTSKNQQLVVMSLAPGQSVPTEEHDYAQFVRVEAGEAVFEVDGDRFTVSEDESVSIAESVTHTIYNASESV